MKDIETGREMARECASRGAKEEKGKEEEERERVGCSSSSREPVDTTTTTNVSQDTMHNLLAVSRV